MTGLYGFRGHDGVTSRLVGRWTPLQVGWGPFLGEEVRQPALVEVWYGFRGDDGVPHGHLEGVFDKACTVNSRSSACFDAHTHCGHRARGRR